MEASKAQDAEDARLRALLNGTPNPLNGADDEEGEEEAGSKPDSGTYDPESDCV